VLGVSVMCCAVLAVSVMCCAVLCCAVPQDELDASPAVAVKARRRQQAKAASPTAANKGKGASRVGGARQTSTGAARPGGKGAEQQKDAAGAGAGKPPAGRGKRTAGQKVSHSLLCLCSPLAWWHVSCAVDVACQRLCSLQCVSEQCACNYKHTKLIVQTTRLCRGP